MTLSWKRVTRTAAAVVTVLAVAALPATASASSPAPETRAATTSSSGWNDNDCRPSAEHPRAVVLVPGTGGNKTNNFLTLAPYLVNRGYCVFSLDYGQLPGLSLFSGLGPVDKSAEELSRFVDGVLATTGTSEVDIVGHSQGGMMPRYYLKFLGGAAKVNTLVGIAPSSHGTDLNGLTKLLDYWPGLGDAIEGATPGLTDQVAGSDFMNRLNAGGDTVPGVNYTVIATRYDEVVTPYQSQFLSGSNVRNILVQDRCAVDISEHLAIALLDRVAFHETANALDPAHATPSNCLS